MAGAAAAPSIRRAKASLLVRCSIIHLLQIDDMAILALVFLVELLARNLLLAEQEEFRLVRGKHVIEGRRQLLPGADRPRQMGRDDDDEIGFLLLEGR